MRDHLPRASLTFSAQEIPGRREIVETIIFLKMTSFQVLPSENFTSEEIVEMQR